jgi:DNA modification methylase
MASISDLRSDHKNARKRTDRSATLIEESLKRYGAARSVVIDEDNRILAGNGTVDAAKRAGISKVRVIETEGDEIIAVKRTGLTEDQKIGLALADNRTSDLSEWDKEMLHQLSEEHDITPWFEAEDLAEIMGEVEVIPPEGLTDADDVPEPPADPITKPGDLWILGNHRLLCGDSTNPQHVERLISGNLANLMVTDPPYGVKLDQSWRDKALGDKAMGKGNANIVANDERADWTEAWVLFEGNIAYVWHASSFTDVVMQSLRNTGLEPTQQIIWNKSVMIMGRSDYHFKHEPCWYAIRKGKTHDWKGNRKQTTVWDAAPPNHIMGGSKEEKTSHPTQKPAALYEQAYLNHTLPNEYVYEPFGGSGTAIVVCERINRRALTMELDPRYCDVIVKRWEDFTGKKAILEESQEAY